MHSLVTTGESVGARQSSLKEHASPSHDMHRQIEGDACVAPTGEGSAYASAKAHIEAVAFARTNRTRPRCGINAFVGKSVGAGPPACLAPTKARGAHHFGKNSSV